MGGVKLLGIGGIVGPGLWYGDSVLLEQVAAVEHHHWSDILANAIDGPAQSPRAPRGRGELTLETLDLAGYVLDDSSDHQRGQRLVLGLRHIGTVAGTSGCEQFRGQVGGAARLAEIDLDVGILLVPDGDNLRQVGSPAPIGQGHLAGGGAFGPAAGRRGGTGGRATRQNHSCCAKTRYYCRTSRKFHVITLFVMGTIGCPGCAGAQKPTYASHRCRESAFCNPSMLPVTICRCHSVPEDLRHVKPPVGKVVDDRKSLDRPDRATSNQLDGPAFGVGLRLRPV